MNHIKIWFALSTISILGSSAWADGIPEQVIQNQHKACVETCVAKAGSAKSAICESVCTCVDIETQKNYTASEFSELERQIASAANPEAPSFTPEIEAKVDTVFSTCGLVRPRG